MLNELKLLLGIALDDASLDDRLSIILNMATERLKALLGGIEPPESMRHIVLEAAIIRYNRIGSEGMTSHTVEGESSTFVDNDFASFSDEIQAFLDMQKETARGRVRFL